MPSSPSTDRYTAVAVTLHWLIAVFILFNLSTGVVMESLSHAMKDVVVPLHTSSGMTILGLSLARLAWRLTHRPPPLDPMLSPMERRAAHAVHGLLYVLMIAMPLIGWGIQSSSARMAQNYYFFVVPMAKLAPIARAPGAIKHLLHARFVLMHTVGAAIMAALLLAHVAGALKHQFFDRRPQLARMWFGGLLSRD